MEEIKSLNEASITKVGENMNIDTGAAQAALDELNSKFKTLQASKDSLFSEVSQIIYYAQGNREYDDLKGILNTFAQNFDDLSKGVEATRQALQSRIDALESGAASLTESAQDINKSLTQKQQL